jgi:uncharacterized membrane protein
MSGYIEFILIYVLIVIFDSCWFTIAFNYGFYKSIDSLMKKNKDIKIGILVWFLMAIMQFIFIKPLIIDKKSLYKPIVYGAILGFCMFGIYNGTNLVFLDEWKYDVAIIDTLWGTVSQALISYISYKYIYTINS